MSIYKQPIISIIESNYKKFTLLEKTIADFFIRNTEIMDFSADNIAKVLYVSKPTITRFSKKCGFSGYREFIYVYQTQLSERTEGPVKRTKTIIDIYKELINRANELVNDRQMKMIVEFLNSSDNVLACGIGSSGLAAQEMESRFMRVGVKIHSIINEDKMKMQTVFLNQKDLVIGMSLSGITESVLYILKKAHERGAKTVLFTANTKGKYEKICDEVIRVPSLPKLDRGNQISPQFPLLIMVDIIFASYISENQYQKEAYHEDTVRALNKGEV